jgi:hypothetical protein
MCFAAKMPGAGSARSVGIPLQHRKLRLAAVNDEPMSRGVGKPAADFAAKLLTGCHATNLVSQIITKLGTTRVMVLLGTIDILPVDFF